MIKRAVLILSALLAAPLWGATQADFREFLPAGKLIHEGKSQEGIARLKKMAPRNEFASVALYLIYSRGYCGEKINLPLAVRKYLDPWAGTPFQKKEYELFRKKMFPKSNKLTYITVKSGRGTLRAQLAGKYPRKECYDEKMKTLGGGVVPMAIMEVVRPWDKWGAEAVREAEKMGCVRAIGYTSKSVSSFSSEYKELLKKTERRAEQGHIPSQIALGETYVNGYPGQAANPWKAGKYLHMASATLQPYVKLGCTHAQKELDRLRPLLARVPAADPQEKIPGSNDEADRLCRKLIARSLENGEKIQVMLPQLRELAEKGSHAAMIYMLNNGVDTGHGRLYFLAGKFNLKYSGFKTQDDFYRKSFSILRNSYQSLKITRDEYRKKLSPLTGISQDAKDEYSRLFERPMPSQSVKIKVARPEGASYQWKKFPSGNEYLEISVSPCSQQNFLDFTMLPGSRKNTYFHLSGSVRKTPDEVWMVLSTPSGKTHNLHINVPYTQERPDKFRLNIAPTDKSFKLTLQGEF